MNVLCPLHLVCILYYGCFNLFCNAWVCVGVFFVMCGCFGNRCTCIYLYVLLFPVFCIVCTVFLYCFFYVYFNLTVLSVLM